MASPKGEFTPKTGPLAGTTYSSYYRYQVERSQALYGYQSYSQERAAKAASSGEAMYRVVEYTMRSQGANKRQITDAYLRMRQDYNGRHPSRNTVRKHLRDSGYLGQADEPDWGQAS